MKSNLESNLKSGLKSGSPDAPKFFSTAEAAVQLGEPPTTVRYWADEFEKFLRLERHGRNRRFTVADIELLRQVQRLLRVKHMTIKQAKDYLVSVASGSSPSDPPSLLLSLVIEQVNEELNKFALVIKRVLRSETQQLLESWQEKLRAEFERMIREEVTKQLRAQQDALEKAVSRLQKRSLWERRLYSFFRRGRNKVKCSKSR